MDDENETGVETSAVESGTHSEERNYAAELEAANAAVAQRDATIAEHANTIAARDAEILEWKARNFDLMNSAPAESEVESVSDELGGEPYSELFGD
jgi:uncharacterized protein (DUF3084 family)